PGKLGSRPPLLLRSRLLPWKSLRTPAWDMCRFCSRRRQFPLAAERDRCSPLAFRREERSGACRKENRRSAKIWAERHDPPPLEGAFQTASASGDSGGNTTSAPCRHQALRSEEHTFRADVPAGALGRGNYRWLQ